MEFISKNDARDIIRSCNLNSPIRKGYDKEVDLIHKINSCNSIKIDIDAINEYAIKTKVESINMDHDDSDNPHTPHQEYYEFDDSFVDETIEQMKDKHLKVSSVNKNELKDVMKNDNKPEYNGVEKIEKKIKKSQAIQSYIIGCIIGFSLFAFIHLIIILTS